MQEKYTEYTFHPQLEIFQCAGGVLICYILGNRISFFENSMDSDFSSFISKRMKFNKPFSVKDMKEFFFEKGKKYNFGKIMYKLEKNGLINKLKGKTKKSLLFINLTEIPDESIINVSREVGLESYLTLVDGLSREASNDSLHKKLEEVKDNQIIFVLSDFQYKHKVSELNLYFFKKGIFWCPIVLDTFGGYIGPLIHSVPSGPCFSCYEEKMYQSKTEEDQKFNLPIFLNIFLRVAFLEALKVGTNISPSQVIYSNLLEIDCFNHRSRKHYIYTNSNCTVCGI